MLPASAFARIRSPRSRPDANDSAIARCSIHLGRGRPVRGGQLRARLVQHRHRAHEIRVILTPGVHTTGKSTTVTAMSCGTARNRVPTGRVANAPGSVDAGHRCSFTVDATHEKNPGVEEYPYSRWR